MFRNIVFKILFSSTEVLRLLRMTKQLTKTIIHELNGMRSVFCFVINKWPLNICVSKETIDEEQRHK